MGWVTTWTETPDTDAAGGNDQNYRNIIATADISTSGTNVRLTFTGHSSTAGQIDGASIGERDGTADDMADVFNSATFKRLKFSGNDYGVLPAGGTLVSDELAFTLDEAKDYLVHFFSDDGNLAFKGLESGTAGCYDGTYGGGTDYTETQTVSFSLQVGKCRALSKIEVEVVTELSIDVSECEKNDRLLYS